MRHGPYCMRWRLVLVGSILLLASGPALLGAGESLGIFEAQADIGSVSPAGTASYDDATKQYRITSAGQNIWGTHDDFHFLYRKISGDVTLTADVTPSSTGKNSHRKAGWMIRQGLAPDDAYADVMVHGEGLISLQYRKQKGGITEGIKSDIKSPATVRLERRGNEFTLFVAAKPAGASDKAPEFQRVGSVTVELKDPVYAGLAVSAHEANVTETAVFSDVSMKQGTIQPHRP